MDNWFVQVKECGGDGGGVSYFAESRPDYEIVTEYMYFCITTVRSDLVTLNITDVANSALFLPQVLIPQNLGRFCALHLFLACTFIHLIKYVVCLINTSLPFLW